MRLAPEFGEAIVRGDTAAVSAEKPFGCFAQEAVMLKLGVPSDDAARGLCAQCFRGIATGPEYLAVVQIVVTQAAAQFEVEQSRTEGHCAPGRRRHRSLDHRDERGQLAFALLAVHATSARIG
jgi:hypothetical protein